MKKESAKRENTIERTGKKVWEGVRAVSVKVVRFSFWEMAFLAFLLRLLVTPPFGAALALAAGSLWFYRNFATIEKSANFRKRSRRNTRHPFGSGDQGVMRYRLLSGNSPTTRSMPATWYSRLRTFPRRTSGMPSKKRCGACRSFPKPQIPPFTSPGRCPSFQLQGPPPGW